MRPDLPKVPLEAGAGPENPPCPACGEPLFVWVELPTEVDEVAHRCESCGLGVIGADAGQEAALAALEGDREPDGSYAITNKASLQAWLGGGAWTGLDPSRRFVFTPESVRRLVASRDQLIDSARWMPGASVAAMWQTGVNMFTFGHNTALARLGRRRRGTVVPGRAWQRALDWFITAVLAVPAIVIAVPLELIGAAFRRGGVTRLKLIVL